ncbi:galactonate dehydratase [Cryptococcus deuterogattii 99/473]|uniref:Galactonate dehydratase n=1 Tax=Cryptococcus deuterogattii Ram5 TaxID=1296110 RepID=A0A0D0TZP2_9TREE|nr:galactonate dehydratase [Cryptococcus deuterogattii LA55]KIR34187.1 galactonate dehydratase [Cryptococcus deuterogattii MMRL2647]KIR41428.1 galactonate dehydratase [Cryptococcus deuterogattii Ram5]KIR71670.1 galactonate dehydratase [Cryptococcus deuterogattii CA1014]KIR91253.1 galactonate dehydratase [Cryptococcus deuterogattii CBS 10090]KIR98559.1 galactonate dehydratase [Cryptococcus deuterogattii 2001/935-1]KIY56514.1 galactonate dehydratase [Cryptococcus deuterogattii 99/473]
MSVNPPQPVNVTTDSSVKADREAVYLPPSELALKYNKGLQRPLAVQPHPSASQAGSTKIKKIETFYVRPRWLFVRVETEGGVVGWGEGTLEGHTEAVQVLTLCRLIGWDAMNIEEIYTYLYRHRFYRGGEVLMSAMSGVDIALWDIKGKVLGVPVWELLGGKVRERCDVYGWVGGDRPSDVAEQAKVRKEQGFRFVKMNATESIGWLDSPHALDDTVKRLAEVKAIGIDAGLPFFIEEPLLPGHVNELKDLYNKTNIPIALGERLFTRLDVRPYLEAGCIDLIQPDIAHAGGISETKKIAIMAEAYDVGLAPHCPLGPLAFAASLHVGFSTPNFVICEMSLKMHYNVGKDLLSYMLNPEVFDIENGSIGLLTAPGLGIELNEDMIRKEAAEAAELEPWINPLFRGEDGAMREW